MRRLQRDRPGVGAVVVVTAKREPDPKPPCVVHSLVPHAHPVVGEGASAWRKRCSARYSCGQCGSWVQGKPCHSDVPPVRKAG